jgi:hypothetical protein
MSNQTTEKKNSITKVVTGKARLSYANLFVPKAAEEGQNPKYSVAVLIPKSDKATLTRIKAAIDAVKKDPASEKLWGKPFNSEMKAALRDGDLKADENPEYAGHYFFNCSSFQKPGVVDRNLNPVLDQNEVYSGCYARVSVNFYAFNKGGGKGVAVGLNNVQKLEDGEPLSGRSRAEDDFGALDGEDGDDFLG